VHGVSDKDPSEAKKSGALARYGRIALFVLGVGLAVFLVRGVGIERVGTVLADAKGYVPLIFVLEILIVVTDVLALRALLGPAVSRVPGSVWIRSSAIAYASSVLLPAGRAVGEAMRVRALAPELGAPRATGAASRLQIGTLYANALISLVILADIVATGEGKGPLAIAVIINAAACALLASLLLALVRSKRFAAWLSHRFKGFVQAHTIPDELPAPPGGAARAVGFCGLGRVVQTVQYGVAVKSVGGAATLHFALSAQGIHLVGALAGDLVPNQIGVTEGAYRAFAHSLGFDNDPARALGIALLTRIAQIGLAVACLGIATIVAKKKERPAGA
jgi:hypothetical protein